MAKELTMMKFRADKEAARQADVDPDLLDGPSVKARHTRHTASASPGHVQ